MLSDRDGRGDRWAEAEERVRKLVEEALRGGDAPDRPPVTEESIRYMLAREGVLPAEGLSPEEEADLVEHARQAFEQRLREDAENREPPT